MLDSVFRRTVILPFIAVLFFTSQVMSQDEPIPELDDLESVSVGLPVGPVTVYTARRIITMDPAQPEGEAIAVRGNEVLGVGSLAELALLTGDNETRIDNTFKDKVILPGFIEPHIHPSLSAIAFGSTIVSIEDWEVGGQQWPAARNHVDYLRGLSKALGMLERDAPLVSWGYHQQFHGSVTRMLLDMISSDRPIVIWHRSAHEFILNSKAMEVSGIVKQDLEALPDALRKHANFNAGRFQERAAFEYLLPRISSLLFANNRMQEGLALTRDYLHKAGVTTAAEPGGLVDPAVLQAVSSAYASADTPFRFYMIPDGRLATQIEEPAAILAATEKMSDYGGGRVSVLPKQVKLFADGAMFSQLMQMQEGYLDGHEGAWLMEPVDFANAFQVYWDAGYQIHVHQNGDAGLKLVLDTLAQSIRRQPREDHRTTLVHFGFAKPAQISRMAGLGVVVSANPYYPVVLGKQYKTEGIGAHRIQNMVPLASAIKAGVRVTVHSDMPMAPAQPLHQAWAAVNRMGPEGEVSTPEERISIEDALRAITIEAAWSLRLEDKIGSLSAGKLANMTVLENDPLRTDAIGMKDIPIWGTVLEGKLQPLED